MDSVNKVMTPAEKADSLKKLSHELGNHLYDEDYELLLEAAAHFRTLIPDANGLLPCPMCGARAHTPPERYKGMVWYRARCIACGLLAVRECTKLDAIAAWNRRGGVVYE